MKKIIDIIGAATDHGLHIKGASGGPDGFRTAGIIDTLKKQGLRVNDLGNISSVQPIGLDNARLKNLEAVNSINSKIYDIVFQSLKNKNFPLVLGGDHSLAAGSVLAAKAAAGESGLIWVDAHGDFNTEENSPSGNIHGMPFSAITTGKPKEIIPFLQKKYGLIDPKNCVLFGARDLDKDEEVRLKQFGISIITMAEIQNTGISKAVKKALAIAGGNDNNYSNDEFASDAAGRKTNGIYLSFDIDSLDPSFAPGVSTSVDGGLSYQDALYLCQALKQSRLLIGAEFVEYNPLNDIQNKTVHTVIGLITALF